MKLSPKCSSAAKVALMAAVPLFLLIAVQNISAAKKSRTTKNMNAYTSNKRIISKRANEDFTPDANLNKPVWKHADWVHVDNSTNGEEHYPQSATDIATVWTPDYIYLAYRCKYTVLNLYQDGNPSEDKWQLWDRDVVEAFINPDPARINHYYEFEVSPNNLFIDLEINLDAKPFNDPHWNSNFEHATHIDSAHHVWTCEMRIPAKSMGASKVSAGDEWRINLFRADGLGNDTQRRFLAWSTILVGDSFHVPKRFGIVEFKK